MTLKEKLKALEEKLKPGVYQNGTGREFNVLPHVLNVVTGEYMVHYSANYGPYDGLEVVDEPDLFLSELRSEGFLLREPKGA